MRYAIAILLLFTAPLLAQPARFTIHADEPVGPPIVGFGAQMNPYLYAPPNWGDVTEENVRELEAKVVALAPQHVRIFFALEWWDGGRDYVAKDDPRMKESFLRTAKLAHRSGASINLTYWHGPWPDPKRQASRFAEIVKELRDEHGVRAIKYVTLQNEPNLHNFDKDNLTTIYRAFHDRARAIGLRDDIQIIGGDLVQDDQKGWFDHLARTQADVLDGYAVHMYWDYWDTAKLLRRISEVPSIVAALPEKARKPIYVTEFGVRGKREKPNKEPGVYEPDGRVISDVPLQGMQVAWFMIEAINRGYAATVQWDLYTAWYDRYMPYGMIGGAKEGWALRPAYHVLQLFTHTTKPGWRAVKVDGAGDELLVSAMRGPKGEVSAFVLNRSSTAREVSLDSLPHDRPLRQVTWNGDGRGKLAEVVDLKTSSIMVPANGLVAITTEQVVLE